MIREPKKNQDGSVTSVSKDEDVDKKLVAKRMKELGDKLEERAPDLSREIPKSRRAPRGRGI